MAVTLWDIAKTVQDPVKKGVIEIFATKSPVLKYAPLEHVPEGVFKYAEEQLLPDVGFRGLNEASTKGKSLLNPQVEVLAILSSEIEIDVQTLRRKGDAYKAGEIARHVKAQAYKYTWAFFKGDSGADPRYPDGLEKRITGTQLISAGTNGGQLTLDLLDELIDALDEKPDVLYMNKTMRRYLRKIARDYIKTEADKYNISIDFYNGIPIEVIDKDGRGNEILPFNEVQGTASNTTSIYAVKFSEGGNEGVVALADPLEPDVRELGESSSKAVDLTRIEWNVGLAVYSAKSVARLKGLLPPV